MSIINSNINNVMYRGGDADALYHGANLIWRRETIVEPPIEELSNVMNITSANSTYQANTGSTSINPTYQTFNSNQDYIVEPEDFVGTAFLGSSLNSWSDGNNRSKNILRVNKMPSVKYVTNATGMFNGCANCEYIPKLDFSSNLKNMSYLFCSVPLTEIDVSGYDTSNVEEMRMVFFNMTKLKSLDVSSFNLKNTKDISGMFGALTSCTSIKLGENFSTSGITNMSGLFEEDNLLESLDLGKKFDTRNVTNMSKMFQELKTIKELDLGDNFYTDKVTGMYLMFNHCENLRTLKVGNHFSMQSIKNSGGSSDSSDGMFLGCYWLTNIEGRIYNIQKSISFAHSPLSNETADMIIDGLSNVTRETITFSTTTYPQLTEEQKRKATNKGWTIALG